MLEKCSKNEDTRLIADIARMVSWLKLWDLALNDGPKCVNALCAFVRYPSHSNRACPTCYVNSLDCSLLAHTLSTHVDTSNDASDILDSQWAPASIPRLPTRMPKILIMTQALQVLYEHCKRLVYHRSGPIIIKLWLWHGFSNFLNIIYPLHMFFHIGLSCCCHSVMYCHFYPTVQVSYMYVLCPLGL